MRVDRPVPDFPEGPPTRTGPTQGSSDPSRTSLTVPRPVQDIPEFPPTRPGPPRNVSHLIEGPPTRP